LTRAWQLLAGPITLLLVARHFTPELQGFYYTFASLLALQSFVELGFYLVIINVASHEWAHLRLDRAGHIVGAPDVLSRLVSLGRLIFKWYAIIGIIFVVAVSIIGLTVLSQAPDPGIAWRAPWLALVALTGVLLWTMPFTSLLEGCNQVATINGFRLTGAVLNSLALWLSIAIGGGLWAAAASVGAKLSCELYLVTIRYRKFFAPFLMPPAGARICWRTEIWPMQWRLGFAGLVNYFGVALFTPVLFLFHGASVAGRMGMTLQLVAGVQAVAMAWVSTKAPSFGILVARRDRVGLDRLWLRSSLISLAVIIGGAGVVWLVVYGLNASGIPLAQRMLEPFPTGLLLLAAILMHISQCQTAYILAHKRAPFVAQALISGLATGITTLTLGRSFGPVGIATGYLLVVAAFIIPYETALWRRCRAEGNKV
jgi:hypothetical protein